jgi:hypothetical protein
MLLYNVTIGIDKDVELEWLQWVKEEHIPSVMNTGLFVSSTMYKILHDQGEGTVSYSIQYFAEDIRSITNYLDNFAPAIMLQQRKKFSDKHVAFQTLLEEV